MNKPEPRILYVSSCWPHDRAHGGQLRVLQIGRALQHFGKPALVVVGADPVEPTAREQTELEFEVLREIPIQPAPVRGFPARLRFFCDPLFTNVHGMQVSPADEGWLLETSRQFDLVWFCKLRTANYFAAARWPRSVCDLDDLPSALEVKPLRRRVLRRIERHLGKRFDALCVCSENDRQTVGAATVIPNGVARPATTPARQPVSPVRIGFMGLVTYQPNADGVRWFIEQCWPQVQRELPGARLRLVGKGTETVIGADIDGLGWLADPAAEVATWSAMIVPVFSGAGTRVKIPDAFSRKCPLVATSLGAFGYDVQQGRELLLADDPDDFAAACISLIRDPAAAAAMAERAYGTFLEKWTWDAIAPRVWAAVEDGLRRGKAGER